VTSAVLPVRLTRDVSGLVLTSLSVVVASALAAVVLQRPYLVALGVPCLLVVLLGLLLDGPAAVSATVSLTDERLVEGDDAEMVVELSGHAPGGRVVVELAAPDWLTYAEDTPAVRVVDLPADGAAVVRFRITLPVWGVHRWLPMTVVAPAPLGLVAYRGSVEVEPVLRVLPSTETLKKLARPSRTGLVAGSRVASAKAEGFEFADIRAFVPGDRRRHVNWRATARQGDLRVNDHHPERSTDVVLMLDAFPTAGLPDAVRATVSLASAYLAERDRVGLVRFGTLLDWLTPAMGPRQLYRIVDVLLESSAMRGLDRGGVLPRLPIQALPPGALVIAVTSLPDSSSVWALSQVAAVGARLVVVEVAAESSAPRGPTPSDRLAYALWRLGLAETRDRLRDRGIPVVQWHVDQPLAPVIEEVATFQRYARHRSR
jgi:uncharacterized protein (DUF58 family)